MSLTGTLKDFSVTDVIQLIGQQSKSGVLHLRNDDGEEIHISFHQGAVVGADHVSRKQHDLLGSMLVRARLIDEHQLADALDIQKRTLRRLGDILVEQGVITRDLVREMTQLQINETLAAIFYWKRGSYQFEAKPVYWDAESVTPIRAEAVLMDGFRRVDEWPIVRKKIVSGQSTFVVLKPLPEPASRQPIDPTSFADLADDDEEIGLAERRVMELVEPGRTVDELVDLSRLGAFETWRALANLVEGGYLRLVLPQTEPGKEREKGRRRLGRNLAVIAYAALAAALLLGAVGLAMLRAPGAVAPLRTALGEALDGDARERVHFATEVYRLREGRAPTALDELVRAGLLRREEARRAGLNAGDSLVVPSSTQDSQERRRLDGDHAPSRVR